jgi:hypothetical protein
LAGERFVFEQEVERLNRIGKRKLAQQVELVSCSFGERGFDIKSYDDDETEIHIEVKSTSAMEGNDRGFWLSESERVTAEEDPRWRLYRVWAIDDRPHYRDLGNVITAPLLN